MHIGGFPGYSDGEESVCNVGDLGSIPGSGRYPGEGNGYPLQYSCLGNPMDRGAWQASGGCKEPDTTDGLTLSFFFFFSNMSTTCFFFLCGFSDFVVV